MAVVVTIAGTNRSKLIARNTLSINDVLTRQVNTAKFTLRYTGVSKTFKPTIGNEISITNNGTTIFAGNITRITQKSRAYKMLNIQVECAGWGRRLDRFLVNDSFQNLTVLQILTQIFDEKDLAGEGFTLDNVETTRLVAFISFKYEPLSSVLRQLADLLLYDWYVDVDKDIHFFSKETNSAPFDIQDDDGSFIFESMVFRDDSSQIRNVIFVRGGEFLGANSTSEYISDGTQNVYTLDYRYNDVQVSVTGEVWEGGIDGTEQDANDFDYMWNPDEKFIRFRGDRIPSNTSQINISGEPFLPVLVKLKDSASIATFSAAEGGSGEYEHIIIDKSIDSKEGARERARAEMDSYANSITEGEFETYTDGLKSGQWIRINSEAFGIDSSYIINRVSARMWTENQLIYKVSLVSTKTFGMIDFLRNLITKNSKDIVINENDILDVVEAFNEEMTMGETITSSIDHNAQTETVTMSESFTAQSIDYEVEFVLGPYVQAGPGSGDHKRVFLLDSSKLG